MSGELKAAIPMTTTNNECEQKAQVGSGRNYIGGIAPNPAVADAIKHAAAVKDKLAAETEQNDAVLGQLKVIERTQRLDNLFSYHAPTDEQQQKYERLRWGARSFAETLMDCTPEGADQSAALRKVREAVMTANAAIACGGKS